MISVVGTASNVMLFSHGSAVALTAIHGKITNKTLVKHPETQNAADTNVGGAEFSRWRQLTVTVRDLWLSQNEAALQH
jgi:hypothetical protein